MSNKDRAVQKNVGWRQAMPDMRERADALIAALDAQRFAIHARSARTGRKRRQQDARDPSAEVLAMTAYNFVRSHKTLRCSPAMAAGVSKTLWEGTARTGVFTLKLSDEERIAIQAAAERAGTSVSQWARAALSAAAWSIHVLP
jgi:hypothetical protein